MRDFLLLGPLLDLQQLQNLQVKSGLPPFLHPGDLLFQELDGQGLHGRINGVTRHYRELCKTDAVARSLNIYTKLNIAVSAKNF